MRKVCVRLTFQETGGGTVASVVRGVKTVRVEVCVPRRLAPGQIGFLDTCALDNVCLK